MVFPKKASAPPISSTLFYRSQSLNLFCEKGLTILQSSLCFYLLLILLPFIGTIVFTSLFIKFAQYYRLIDKPGSHKTHIVSKPTLGGVTIFICFTLTALIFIPIDNRMFSLLLATLLLIVIGIIDDIYNLKPLVKLTGQVAAVSIFVLWDISLYHVFLDYFDRFYLPDPLILALIIGWVVLMINAFNLIDGLDGLATGTAAIIFLAMVVVSLLNEVNPNVITLQMIGFGACLGFLVFNFNPAKIFVGDTGSMLLGFILATTHLYMIKFPFSAQLVLGSMFIFAYPALDISYTIFRRLFRRVSIFQADQSHIHHVLVSMGFSVRKTVLLIYLFNIFLAALAVVLLTLQIPAPYIFFIGIATFILVIVIFIKLQIISRKNGIDNYSSKTER
jgi:UDP-GlcNAc:undecaprenyl-phosphate/decaprenyl-phosphate GlcNAc-1-phosphate transferase